MNKKMKMNSEAAKKRREMFYRKAYKAMCEYYSVDGVTGAPTALWVFEGFVACQKWRDKFEHCNSYKDDMAILPQLFVDECRKEKPELWCMWSLAVLYNYGPNYKYNPLPENRSESIRLLETIRDRRDELTDSCEDCVIKTLLDDWLKCIRETDVFEEVAYNLHMKIDSSVYCAFASGLEGVVFRELPGINMREGYHIGQRRKDDDWKWPQDSPYFCFYFGYDSDVETFVYDAEGHVYNNVLDFIETDGTAMGKHSMQLLTDLIKGTLIIED